MASNVPEPASQPSLSSNPVQCTVYPCNAMQYIATQLIIQPSPTQSMQCNSVQCRLYPCNAHIATQCNPMQYNALHLNAIHRTSTLIILSSNPQSNAFHESTYPKCIPNAAEAPNVQCYCNDSSEVQKISPNWLQLVQSEEWTKVVKLIPT